MYYKYIIFVLRERGVIYNKKLTINAIYDVYRTLSLWNLDAIKISVFFVSLINFSFDFNYFQLLFR